MAADIVKAPILLSGTVRTTGARRISGIANSPIPDKENEIILSKAMEDAIPRFMKMPILHVDHTERPVGYVTECRVLKEGDAVLSQRSHLYDAVAKAGDTYFEATIPEDGDCEDIWNKIQKGKYNKISIYGVRTAASAECSLHPHERASPCVTKSIRLWSFSLVGNNAINPGSYIKIAKSFSEDLCPEFESNTIELIKSAFPDTSMAPNADQQDQAIDSGNDVTENVVTKSELESVVQDVSLVKGEIAEVKTGVDKILDFISKSTQDATPENKSETQPDEYITKAALEPVLDMIVKAKVELAIADIKKAYDEKILALEQNVKAFGDETIRKGGNAVVFLNSSGDAVDSMDNSFLSNLDALEA